MEVVLPEGGVRRKSGSNHLTMLAWHLVPTKRASFAIPRSPTLGQPDPVAETFNGLAAVAVW